VGSGEGIAEGEVLDLLYGLTEKSLVVAWESEEGGVRYRMLESVRQYARDKLEESEDAEKLRLRHATFFLALAEEAEPELWGPDQMVWLERLEREHDNLRAALSRLIERGEPELGVPLAGALRWFWHGQGHYSEGRRWLEEALSKDNRASVVARVKALSAVGWLAMDQDDPDRVVAAAEEGLELSTGTEVTRVPGRTDSGKSAYWISAELDPAIGRGVGNSLTPRLPCVTCAVYRKGFRHAQQTSNMSVWLPWYGVGFGGSVWRVGLGL
jgi:hypothetical protein